MQRADWLCCLRTHPTLHCVVLGERNTLMGKGKKKGKKEKRAKDCGGRSILQMFWGELDAITARLMAGQGTDRDPGKAEGIAWCIAVTQAPYNPSLDAVREQAMERYEASEQDEIPADYV